MLIENLIEEVEKIVFKRVEFDDLHKSKENAIICNFR